MPGARWPQLLLIALLGCTPTGKAPSSSAQACDAKALEAVAAELEPLAAHERAMAVWAGLEPSCEDVLPGHAQTFFPLAHAKLGAQSWAERRRLHTKLVAAHAAGPIHESVTQLLSRSGLEPNSAAHIGEALGELERLALSGLRSDLDLRWPTGVGAPLADDVVVHLSATDLFVAGESITSLSAGQFNEKEPVQDSGLMFRTRFFESADTSEPFVIAADARTPYRTLATLLLGARRFGFERFTFVLAPREGVHQSMEVNATWLAPRLTRAGVWAHIHGSDGAILLRKSVPPRAILEARGPLPAVVSIELTKEGYTLGRGPYVGHLPSTHALEDTRAASMLVDEVAKDDPSVRIVLSADDDVALEAISHLIAPLQRDGLQPVILIREHAHRLAVEAVRAGPEADDIPPAYGLPMGWGGFPDISRGRVDRLAGKPDIETIEGQIRSARDDVRVCYSQMLDAHLELQDQLEVELTLNLSPKGRVDVAKVSGQGFADTGLANCIEALAQGWQLPPTKDGKPARVRTLYFMSPIQTNVFVTPKAKR